MKELAVFIDTNLKTPVYEQIYIFIKKAIGTGDLKAGDALPSSRAMAESLQCSRSTVLMAYDQLAAEGYIESRPQRGCYVMEIDEQFSGNNNTESIVSHIEAVQEYKVDFSPVGIDADNFPFNEWRKISKQIFLSENAGVLNSGDARGDYELRKNIAVYLRNSRGVKANPDRIILGAGYESLLMILDFVIDNAAKFAMENPVYPKAYKLIKALGRTVIPVELDAYGMNVSELEKTDATIAYVTPSHQYPTGVVMSAKRRQELIRWSMELPNRYIIEDDYDSEFRYKGKPIPSLQGMDVSEKVIYIGTFSKSISPAVRMSYMVLPAGIYEVYAKNMSFFSNTVSRIDQQMVGMFMENGGFERHLNRMRTTYKYKHAEMLAGLKNWRNVEVSGENAGAHMLLRINNNMSEEELMQSAKAVGVKVYSLKDCYIPMESCKVPESLPVIILGYAKLNVEEIQKGLSLLSKAWKLEE